MAEKEKKRPFRFFWEEEPFSELEKMREKIDRMMSGLWGGPEVSVGIGKSFPVDITETPDEVIVKADLPGIDKKNVSIRTTDDEIEIHAEQEEEKHEEDERFLRHERRYGSLHRRFTLPAEVKSDEAEAKMEDGVLEIKLPKKEKEKIKKKEIEVK